MTESEFRFIGDFVHDRSGIMLESGKEYLVETRLRPVLSEHEIESIGQLVRQLMRGGEVDIESSVIEALTTNETYFYRDTGFFGALQNSIFPEVVEHRAKSRELAMWCAACSSGQEPYSILMMLSDCFPQVFDWKFTFIVSDISEEMRKRTRDGIYSEHEVQRGLPQRHLDKYFDKIGDKWQVKEDLRKRLDVREINLVKPWPMMPLFDIVFLRNVLIYFDIETKQGILEKAAKTMRSNGLLFLGSAETTLNISPDWNRAGYPRAGCYKHECV